MLPITGSITLFIPLPLSCHRRNTTLLHQCRSYIHTLVPIWAPPALLLLLFSLSVSQRDTPVPPWLMVRITDQPIRNKTDFHNAVVPCTPSVPVRVWSRKSLSATHKNAYGKCQILHLLSFTEKPVLATLYFNLCQSLSAWGTAHC